MSGPADKLQRVSAGTDAPTHAEGQRATILTSRYPIPTKAKALRLADELQEDVSLKSIPPDDPNVDRHVAACSNVDRTGSKSQSEVGVGSANPQAVGILRSTVLLDISQVDVQGTVLGGPYLADRSRPDGLLTPPTCHRNRRLSRGLFLCIGDPDHGVKR